MMTSSNGDIFRFIGPIWGWWIPVTKANDAELWYFLRSEQTLEQTIKTAVILNDISRIMMSLLGIWVLLSWNGKNVSITFAITQVIYSYMQFVHLLIWCMEIKYSESTMHFYASQTALVVANITVTL